MVFLTINVQNFYQFLGKFKASKIFIFFKKLLSDNIASRIKKYNPK